MSARFKRHRHRHRHRQGNGSGSAVALGNVGATDGHAVVPKGESRLRLWWRGLSHRSRHWLINIALGLAIELVVHGLGHGLHFKPIVDFQNWGLDLVTRAAQASCAVSRAGSGVGTLGRVLQCPESEPAARVPVLIEVDAASWRSTAWGGGEPDRAPRDAMLKLIDYAFALGARQVVLDILVEDRSSRAPGAPAARVEDQAFAQGLEKLLESPHFDPQRRLVLVRTERRPLPDDEHSHFPELRHSQVVDSVIEKSGGRIVVAAPYFRISTDLVLRDWELFKVVCERPREPGAGANPPGLVRVVPSVQLVTAAFDLGLDTGALSPPMGKLARGDIGVTSCSPFPLMLDQSPSPVDGPVQECELTQDRPGVCRAEAKDEAGLRQRYWSGVQQVFAERAPLGALPKGGDPGNRVMFRLAMEDVVRLPAMELLKGQAPERQRFASLLKDRVVVIGQTYEEAGDSFVTPLGRIPGAAVLVNAVHSMSRHGLMQPPASLQIYGVSIFLIVIVGYVFARWSSMVGTIIASAAVVLTAGVGSFFLFAHGVWLDFAAPIVGIQIHKLWAAYEERREHARLVKMGGSNHGASH